MSHEPDLANKPCNSATWKATERYRKRAHIVDVPSVYLPGLLVTIASSSRLSLRLRAQTKPFRECLGQVKKMGVSENWLVPLNPMVNDPYPY